MTRWYVLDRAGHPQPVPSGRDVVYWMSGRNSTIAETEVDGIIVSTYFTGLDLSQSETGPPELWETRIFRGLPGHQKVVHHYTSRASALAGHESVVEFVRREVMKRRAG